MKNVIIISYFFPPCELTASQRPWSWHETLRDYGINSIIVTRKWERPIKTYSDMGHSTSPGVDSQIEENRAIYSVPHKATYKDKIFARFENHHFVLLRRLISFFEMLIQNLSVKKSIYNNIYQQSRFLCLTKKIDLIIISGNPFATFQIGYLLNKEFGIPWLADYRDAWTTSEIDNIGRSKIFELVYKYDGYFERKWTRTAKCIISVSEPLAQNIAKLTGTCHEVIENGYKDDLFNDISFDGKYSAFTVTYIGTLYLAQRIDIFLDAAEQFIQKKHLSPNQFQIVCPGLALVPEQVEKITSQHPDLVPFMQITNRIPHRDILVIEKRSDVLLFVGWKGFQGVVPSKIYEYCGSGSFVLVAPGDDGEVNRIVKQTRTGEICNTIEETLMFLVKHFEYKSNPSLHMYLPDRESVERLKRSYQTKKLAEIVHRILD
jgi:glycosyltransferase involved in cell wall biosynthesis